MAPACPLIGPCFSFPFSSRNTYGGKFMRRRRSWKRGSVRKGAIRVSNRGLVLSSRLGEPPRRPDFKPRAGRGEGEV